MVLEAIVEEMWTCTEVDCLFHPCLIMAGKVVIVANLSYATESKARQSDLSFILGVSNYAGRQQPAIGGVELDMRVFRPLGLVIIEVKVD